MPSQALVDWLPFAKSWTDPDVLAPLISGLLVACIGAIATYVFNRRQQEAERARSEQDLRIARAQTLHAFLPALASEDQRQREAAILAITSLDSELMQRIATLFQSEGVVRALGKVAERQPDAAPVALATLERIMATLRPAVVLVIAGAQDGGRFASGFVVADGTVVTVDYALDVVGADGPLELRVRFADGRTAEAQASVRDPDAAVAVLAVDTGSIAPLPLATDVDVVDAASEVVVLGYRGPGEGHVSVGRVRGREHGSNHLLVDVSTEAGFAGAPLVTPDGTVIAMVHARGQDNVSIMIPATTIRRALERLGSPA